MYVVRRSEVEIVVQIFGVGSLRGHQSGGGRRDEGFCSKQYGDQRLITTLRGLGLFDVYPVRNSRGVVQDYEVRPKEAACASPA
jgi:hypothetical protein